MIRGCSSYLLLIVTRIPFNLEDISRVKHLVVKIGHLVVILRDLVVKIVGLVVKVK